MSYKSIHTSLAVCSVCRILWNVDLKEDDSGAGMHAFLRDGFTHYAPLFFSSEKWLILNLSEFACLDRITE
jgi:hypothetical protein